MSNSTTPPLPEFFRTLAEHFANMIRTLHGDKKFLWLAGFRKDSDSVKVFFRQYTKTRCVPPVDSGFDVENTEHLETMLGIVTTVL